MQELRALARLMDYPTDELWAHLGEVQLLVEDSNNFTVEQKRELSTFLTSYKKSDLLDVQAEYFSLFDRGQRASLLLFEHSYGESRDRGQAMVDLTAELLRSGYQLNTNELPDYLPLFLEWLSVLPDESAKQWLEAISPMLTKLYLAVTDHEFYYVAVIGVLLDWANIKRPEIEGKTQPSEQEVIESLDAIWEEEEVRFDKMPDCDSCNFNTPDSL